jgi:hypothetical protein
MTCLQLIISSVFILLMNSGGETKEHPIQGKWYQSSRFYLEFGSNHALYAEQQPGPANKKIIRDSGTYQVENDSTLVMVFLPDNKPEKFIFKIKDSLLLLLHPYHEVRADKEIELYDSSFYHRNPMYPAYHIEQLYKLEE